MTKVIYVTKAEYEEIVRFEDEGGAPRDIEYVIVDGNDPELPVAMEQTA